MKEAGGTFGALSEKELGMLQASASKLSQLADYDESGKMVGFRGSTDNFIKALEDLQQGYSDAIEKEIRAS